MTCTTLERLPDNFGRLQSAISRFADAVRLMSFDDDRGPKLGNEAAKFERYAACVLETTVRRAKDLSDVELLDHDIAQAVEKLGELVACFYEDAVLDRAELPNLEDLKIAIYVGAMSEEDLTHLLHALVAYPTARQSHERTALLDGLAAACVPIKDIGLPQTAIIKLILVIILTLIAQRFPALFQLVEMALNVLAALDRVAQDPRCDCGPPTVGTGGATPVVVAGKLPCFEGLVITQQVGEDNSLVFARPDAYLKAADFARSQCPSRCPPFLIKSRVIGQSMVLPNGDVRVVELFGFSCG